MDALGSRDDVVQSLFARRTAAGLTWEFVVLADGGCAVLRDGERVACGDGDEASVQRVLQQFLHAAGCRAAAAAPPRADALGDEPDGPYGWVA